MCKLPFRKYDFHFAVAVTSLKKREDQDYNTVNVDIFAQYIFSLISRRALDARKFDVSENYYHNGTNRINLYVGEN